MIRAFLLAAALAFAASPQQHHGGDYTHHHVPRSAEEYARILDDPARDAWQKPAQVIQALDLKPGSTVAHIGAGSGYFTLRFARAIGPNGKALAVDIDQKLLDIIAHRAREQKLANVETILAAPNDPRLAPASADLIFFCEVLHHIENRPAYYELLKRALKPGGRVVVIDFHKKPLPVGPPPEMKIDRSGMKTLFCNVSFCPLIVLSCN
jgi:ubiquinone/menaquinone biosynthesis C-methylase UbiE